MREEEKYSLFYVYVVHSRCTMCIAHACSEILIQRKRKENIHFMHFSVISIFHYFVPIFSADFQIFDYNEIYKIHEKRVPKVGPYSIFLNWWVSRKVKEKDDMMSNSWQAIKDPIANDKFDPKNSNSNMSQPNVDHIPFLHPNKYLLKWDTRWNNIKWKAQITIKL